MSILYSMGFLDFLFPKSCLECKKEGQYICQICLKKVEVKNRFDPITQTFSIFAYEGIIRKAITKIKYNFAYDIASELANICVSKIENWNFKIDNSAILVPIPLHKTRQQWRGFNQSEIIGELISKNMNWKFEKDILIRIDQGKNQVGLERIDRVRNIRGKFALNPKAKLYQNITYIVFDDVATTGSTIQEAIKVLKANGAQKITGLTIAR